VPSVESSVATELPADPSVESSVSAEQLAVPSADASHGNGAEGCSYGGMVVRSAGGGALAWRGLTIRTGDDSPAATELRMVAVAYKCILALRILLKDLACGMDQIMLTPLYTDSRSVEQGAACEKVKSSSRWMATCYAMVRWGVTCLTIILLAIASSNNPADMMTKCVLKDAFFRHRDVLLSRLVLTTVPYIYLAAKSQVTTRSE